MGRLFYIMGKSASGKDTLFHRLLQEKPSLQKVTLYTTRPRREGEADGIEYHFLSSEALEQLRKEGRVIEERAYQTVHGVWRYATIDDGRIQLSHRDYLAIGTLESYAKIREYFGRDQVVPLYIEVEDGERLKRAIERERRQAEPKYEELCRRFLADAKDFSEERLQEVGIVTRYENRKEEACIKALLEEIEDGKF